MSRGRLRDNPYYRMLSLAKWCKRNAQNFLGPGIFMILSPARLEALESYGVLDTASEPGFDDIVMLATQICQTSVALVSLVAADRQWFKARVGFNPCETPLGQSVCAYTLSAPDDILVIPDLTKDPRTKENTLVTADPHMRFYAGATLKTPEGYALGALCVIDGTARPGGLTSVQASSLKALARQVMTQLALRKALLATNNAHQKLASQERQLRFAMRAGRLGFWNLDLRTKDLDASSICKENFGRQSYTPFTYDQLRESVHPDDRERMDASMQAAIEAHNEYDIEYRVVRLDGEIGWVFIRGQIDIDSDGVPQRLAGISLDITAQKVAEQRLAKTEEQLSSALGIRPDRDLGLELEN